MILKTWSILKHSKCDSIGLPFLNDDNDDDR